MARKFSANQLFSKANLSIPSEASGTARTQADLESAANGKLDDRYVVPPFTVFNTHTGAWQNRKRAYLSLGIKSEVGRGANLGGMSEAQMRQASEGSAYKDKDGKRARSTYETFGISPDGTPSAERRSRGRANASPGGSPRPATKRGKDGHTVRGTGSGRALYSDKPAEAYPTDTLRDKYNERAKANGTMAYTGPVTDPGSLGRRYAGGPRPHSNHTGNRDLRPGRDGTEDYKGGDAWLGTGRKANAIPGGGPMPLDRAKAKSYGEALNSMYGREDDAGDGGDAGSGTSIFDPVLCELMYRWFCPPTGVVLDPFAGGSVRGIVAAIWGRGYVGIDLRPEQVAANDSQRHIAPAGARIKWVTGDSRDMEDLLPSASFDFLFTCPPYFNLELYSYDRDDLSNAPDYASFRDSYEEILTLGANRLRDNRFAAIVVGNFRGKDGAYVDFVGDTVKIMQRAGLAFYNEAILVTAIGSLPLRTRNQFRATRKMGKTHQQVLIFVKGDPRKAAIACRGE